MNAKQRAAACGKCYLTDFAPIRRIKCPVCGRRIVMMTEAMFEEFGGRSGREIAERSSRLAPSRNCGEMSAREQRELEQREKANTDGADGAVAPLLGALLRRDGSHPQ